MPSFYALITTVDVPQGPPGWDTFPKPQPPQPPLGIWGGPWLPPYPSQGPGFPTHPIAGPGRPPWWGMAQDPGYGISSDRPWGPINYPDHGLPGQQPGIWGPNDPRPSPPIYIPPPGGQPPLGIWGPTDPRPGYGLPGPQPHPEHPIVLPPDLPPETEDGGKIDWKVAWTPVTGWVVVGIPAEGTLVPTPSKK
jgi:hypothetical protein